MGTGVMDKKTGDGGCNDSNSYCCKECLISSLAPCNIIGMVDTYFWAGQFETKVQHRNDPTNQRAEKCPKVERERESVCERESKNFPFLKNQNWGKYIQLKMKRYKLADSKHQIVFV